MDERLLGPGEKDGNDLKVRVWKESKKIWRVAFPAMLARVSQFGMFIVTQAFIGHVGSVELAAYALIQIITVRFANGILLEMSSATETLCGQAFGAKQYHMMGIYLQRSWIINLATATLLLPVFIFSAPIFKLLASLVLHVLLSWLFVTQLNLGIAGAMSAMIIASWLVVIRLFVYVFGGWCPHTWIGFTWAAFSDLFPVLKLSISSGVMLCLEIWYTAVLVLLAGYMKNAAVSISAFSVCLNIIVWEFMLCIGFLAASSVRVSNELGSGNAKAAKFSIKVVICTSLFIGVVFWALCLIFGDKIDYLFTSDEEVVEAVSELSVLLSLSVLLNSFQCVLSGVAVGAGRPGIVAYVNFGCYYMIGVPVGVLLGYVAELGVKGMWIGMTLGIASQALVLDYITWRTDWDEQVNKASERLNKWFLRPADESNANPDQERLNG